MFLVGQEIVAGDILVEKYVPDQSLKSQQVVPNLPTHSKTEIASHHNLETKVYFKQHSIISQL